MQSSSSDGQGQIISINQDHRVTAMQRSSMQSIKGNAIGSELGKVTIFPNNMYKNQDTIIKMQEYEENEAVSCKYLRILIHF